MAGLVIATGGNVKLYTWNTREYWKCGYANNAFFAGVVVGGWFSPLLVSKEETAVCYFTQGDYSSGVLTAGGLFEYDGETWYYSADGAAMQGDVATSRSVIGAEVGILNELTGVANYSSRETAARDLLDYYKRISALPEGAAQLEYIKGTGTQCINTGVSPSTDLVTTIRLKPDTDGMSENGILGSTWSANGYFLMFYQSLLRWHSRGYSVDVSAFDINGVNELKVSSSSFDVNGTIYTLSGSGTDSTNPIYLYATADRAASGDYDSFGRFACYDAQMVKAGKLIRDYVPVILADGSVGLWDKMNGVFYGNVGTGTFIPGYLIPIAPENFRVSAKTDKTLTVAWDDVVSANGYRLYLENDLLSDLVDTSYTFNADLFFGYQLRVAAYNDNGESAAATLSAVLLPDNPTLYLVTDRTQTDLAALKSLHNRHFSTWTDAEREEYIRARNKGAYNHTDLNRVESAMEYINSILTKRGYITGYQPSKRLWHRSEIPTVSQMQQYLSNVAKLKAVVVDGVSTVVPADMEKLTIAEANAIEQILVTVNDLLSRMLLTLVPAGTATSGGDYL